MRPSGVSRRWQRARAVIAVAWRRWLAPQSSLFAAALAFQALLAMAPMLLVLLMVAGRLLGRESTRQSLAEAALRFAGPGADEVVASFVELIATSGGHTAGTVVGVTLMLYFASSFFVRLHEAFDAVWEVRDKRFGRKLADRAASFGLTLVAVAVSLAVLAAGVARAIVGPLLARSGGVAGEVFWSAWTRLGTLAMTALVLAAAFRYIPSVRPRPPAGAVIAGAVPASLALQLANEVIGLVIARSALVSLYGAGATLVAILLWAQYSALIVLLGAELCRAWSESSAAASPKAPAKAP